jgi:hypothetical protein
MNNLKGNYRNNSIYNRIHENKVLINLIKEVAIWKLQNIAETNEIRHK